MTYIYIIWYNIIYIRGPPGGPPGGRGNLRIVPSVSLHAVKGSEWIMWERYWEAAHSQLFPRGTPWPVDWRNYLFHSWLYAGFGGAGRASGLMFHCHDTFNLEVSQTHATCTSPTELDFVIHRENWLKTLSSSSSQELLIFFVFFFFTLIRRWDVATSKVSDHQQRTMHPQDWDSRRWSTALARNV